VRATSLCGRLLGVEDTIVEAVAFGEAEVVIAVRVRRGRRQRCGVCGRRGRRYDAGEGRRRWRTLDLGIVEAYLEAEAPRVKCREHGVVVAAVPWARHGARFTRAFEDAAAWLAVHTSKKATAELLRVAWRSVGNMVSRVAEEADAEVDRLSGLQRIGIDEVSYKRGHRYLTVVVDHATGRLVWAAEGRDEATLERFFEQLGPERCRDIELVSADAAPWIGNVVERRCPRATICLDPFHIVRWATDALDEVRRETWNDARRRGQRAVAVSLKDARYALWKNPENLTEHQQEKLAAIERVNRRLFRAYLLKEELRLIFQHGWRGARRHLDEWLSWARRCRIPSFVKLARSITEHRAGIEATLKFGLSNALVESVNTKIRVLTRVAFGFRSARALIAIATLSLGGLCPPLPGRP
jgi:transposase